MEEALGALGTLVAALLGSIAWLLRQQRRSNNNPGSSYYLKEIVDAIREIRTSLQNLEGEFQASKEVGKERFDSVMRRLQERRN